MKTNLKKAVSFLLSLLLLVSALPTAAFASDEPETADDGSYLLGTAEDLLWFSEEVTGGNDSIDAQLTADIDLTGEEWIPIGGDGGYCGTFNGNGFTVTVDITADESYEYGNAGLFGYLYTATVKNLKVAGSVNVSSDGCQFVGAITGGTYEAEIVNCSNAADITVESEAAYVGGIVGFDEGYGTSLTGCANHGTVNAENSGSVGGIIGSAVADEVRLTYCCNSGSLSGAAYTGGLVGEGSVIITSCYSSAGVEDWGAPGGLSSTRSVNGGVPGDLAGMVYGSQSIKNSLCYTDVIVGSGGMSVEDFDGCKRFCDCDTVDDILVLINDGCEEPMFVIDENGFGDGWPVLAWELKEGSTPGENDKALREAKEQAKAEIDSLCSDSLIAENYDPDDRETVTAYRDDAIAVIDAAKEISVVNAALKALKANIAAVPTASDRLADYKKTAAAAVEKAYFYQDVGPYSTRDFGYKADLAKIIVSAGRLGLRHDLADELLRQLDGDMILLGEQKDAGIDAVNAASNKSGVDTAKDNAIAAMEQTVKTAGQRTADSGVADKWDGASKVQPSGSGTKKDPYLIGTAAELAWFADAVNNGRYSLNAELSADIDLGGNAWTPIAVRSDDNKAYYGTFNGNGHTVHGLYVNITKESGGFLGGLFGYIGKGGTVKSLHTAGLISQELGSEYLSSSEKTKYSAGGIAGRSAGIIYGCESSVALTNGKKYSNCNYIGGIVGYQYGGIIESCTSYAVLFQSGSANFQYCFGGVAGSVENGSLIRYTDSYADIDIGNNVLGNIGGITGTMCDMAQIRECRNYGSVHFGNGIVGSVLDQAGVAYVVNSGSADGENSLNVTPGAAIAGRVDTSGELIGLYNDGECVYGLVNTLVRGTVRNAQSSAEAGLWGKVDIQHSVMQYCVRLEQITPEESTRSDGALGQAKLDAAYTLLGKMKTNNDTVYGTQSDIYNAVILTCLRKTELAVSIDEVDALLAAIDGELQSVPTQLEVEKEMALRSFGDYISARVYDESVMQIMTELLSEAAAEANDAGTVKALSAVCEKYLGTGEKPGLFETSCDTYNTKAKNELYNKYLYGKTYSEEDTAKLYACYEKWGVKIDRAASIDEIDTLFADAGKALHDLSAKMSETGNEPDADKIKLDALSAAKTAAQDEISALCGDSKKQIGEILLSAEEKGYTDGFLKALRRTSDAFTAQAEKTASLDFKNADTFAAVEDILNTAKSKLTEYTENTARRMNALIALAEESASSAWDGVTQTEPALADGIYQISNGAELAWLANYVNSRSSRTVLAELTDDIDLAYREWTPIGLTPDGGNGFYGTLNGNGHIIKGLYISSRNSCGYYGLIGVLRGQSTVCNLDIYGTIELDGVTSKECVGALVADSYGATVENCRSYAEIRISGIDCSSIYASAVGGLIGKAASAFGTSALKITGCTFRGSIVITETDNNREPKGVGGIIGRIEGDTSLLRCANYGTVETDKALGVGGIVGNISTYLNQSAVLTECANWGTIENDADNVMDAKGGTGGVVGVITSDDVEIADCFNTGTVNASKLAGGILGGENESFASGSSSSGSRRLVMRNCYNAGKLLGPNNQGSSKIGSLVGYPINGEYKDGLYLLNGCAQKSLGWISSRGDSVYTVDASELDSHFADGVKMIKSFAGLNGTYPLFKWQISDSDIRKEIAEYLTRYYDSEIGPYVSAEQSKTLSDILNTKTNIIFRETDPDTVIAAYNDALAAMDKQSLAQEAKEAALEALKEKASSYAEKYPEYADKIEALKEEFAQQINDAESPAQTDTVIDRFDAAVVELLIDSIGGIDGDSSVEEIDAVRKQIDTAQEAYDSLTDSKKDQVGNFVKLIDAKQVLASWEKAYTEDKAAADKAIDAIRAVGEVTLDSRQAIEAAQNAYGELTEKQKSMVSGSDRETLENAVKRYNELVDKYNADVDAAASAAEKIASIGKVTLESKAAIEEAENAYNALTDDQKEMIPEEIYDVLQKAIAEYAVLESEYASNKDAADRVVGLIESIGTVSRSSGEKISAARNAYDSLNAEQKAMVPSEILKLLNDAEAQYDAILKAEAEKPADTQPTAPPSDEGENTAADTADGKSESENVPDSTPNGKPESAPDTETDTAPAETDESENTGTNPPETETEPDTAETDPTKDRSTDAAASAADEHHGSFDMSIIPIIIGIVLAAALIIGLIYWFVAARRKKRN